MIALQKRCICIHPTFCGENTQSQLHVTHSDSSLSFLPEVDIVFRSLASHRQPHNNRASRLQYPTTWLQYTHTHFRF